MNDQQMERIEEAVYRNQGALDAIVHILACIAKGEAVLAAHDAKVSHQRFEGDPPLEKWESYRWQGYDEVINLFDNVYKVKKFSTPELPKFTQ